MHGFLLSSMHCSEMESSRLALPNYSKYVFQKVQLTLDGEQRRNRPELVQCRQHSNDKWDNANEE